MGIYIGLNSANVNLEAMHYNKSMDVNFNERYKIEGVKMINYQNKIIIFNLV